MSESINERPNDSEKKLHAAIEKTKTDGELNYETVMTKAVTTKPQMEHEKKANEFDQRQESSKKENEGGEKTKSSGEEFVFVKKKAVQKTDSSDDYFEENKSASSDDDFEKNKSAHGNKNEHIEEDMKQKGIELHSLIIETLSDEERNKINQIIKNKEVKSGERYIHYGNKKVSWGSMQRLLKSDTKNHPKRWIDNEVINFYFKNYLAEIDQKQCQEEPEQNCSGFFGLVLLAKVNQ